MPDRQLFAEPSHLDFEFPDFPRIADTDYQPEIEAALAEQLVQLQSIANDPGPASVANVIEAWEATGQRLARALGAFYAKMPADTNDVLDAAEEALAPQLAAHGDAIHQDAGLYRRVRALADRVAEHQEPAGPQASYWLQRKLADFERSGVALPEAEQARLRQLNRRIAELRSKFGRSVLAGRNAAAVPVDSPEELAGLTAAEIQAAAERAQARGIDGWLIELENTSAQRVLESLTDRGLRERIHRASLGRGLAGQHDTRPIVVELARLRAERATLLGYSSHADYVAADGCAGTQAAVAELLVQVAPSAARNARREAAELTEVWHRSGGDGPIQPWDWAHLAAQLQAERFSLDPARLRPYLELERVLQQGVFAAATALYGVTFRERDDLPGYHPAVRCFEVRESNGTPIGLYVADFYTRDGKQGGAWMNSIVDQNELLGQLPVVTNNANLSRPPAGEPTLLLWDEVITLFHEFGHALHGLLSRVRYPSQSGTATPRDFVEYPSQVNEMWALDPELLRHYAVHHLTGDQLPNQWLTTLTELTLFQQGFKTTEYLAAALLDQAWHATALSGLPTNPEQVEAFETAALAAVGLDLELVPPRYRSTYFAHIFEGGYDAAYYSYLWSEVLDADTAAFFLDAGGLTRANGQRFRERLLARGGSIDAMAAYRDFRGADPDRSHLLRRRGLA